MKITEGRLRAGGAADRPEVAQAELAGRLDQDLPRPAVPDKPETTVDPEVVRIRSALLDGVSAETSHAIASSVSAETSWTWLPGRGGPRRPGSRQ